jgi:hypothetical protein
MSNANGSAATCQQPQSDFPQEKKKTCRQLVRALPIERFRLATDGRQWQHLARQRWHLLEYLAGNAEDDGSFRKWKNGKLINFSPSEQRIRQRFGRGTFYRLADDLNTLDLLYWNREDEHYGRRIYKIKANAPHPDTLKPPPRWPIKGPYTDAGYNPEYKQWTEDIAVWEQLAGRKPMLAEIEPIGPRPAPESPYLPPWNEP